MKIGARVTMSVCRIKIAMASACPYQVEFATAHAPLRLGHHPSPVSTQRQENTPKPLEKPDQTDYCEISGLDHVGAATIGCFPSLVICGTHHSPPRRRLMSSAVVSRT